ncbi:MAG: cell division protein ZapB [Treponema sp.]|jgi:FtsZ-binding cell division protein ZapB|nr:cell division protein ZapB [Treponema sp.]
MGTIEHVKLLETKVVGALDLLKRITEENKALKEETQTQKRQIEELEQVIQGVKEDRSLLEEGILSALKRFDEAIEDHEAPPLHNDATQTDHPTNQS